MDAVLVDDSPRVPLDVMADDVVLAVGLTQYGDDK